MEASDSSFVNLKWRLEIELMKIKRKNIVSIEQGGASAKAAANASAAESASHVVDTEVKPCFLVGLELKNRKGEKEDILFQSDYANMSRLARELEIALESSESVHSKRIQKYL